VANFVLIHGVMHGGWFWQPVQSSLVAMGHRAVAPDLAGSGDDPTPLDLIDLDMISRRIVDVVLDAAAEGPVVLVGHSFGGAVIGEVAERVPASLLGLVYVAATLVPPGKSMREATGHSDQPLPFTSGERTVMRPEAELARRLFYNTCTPDRAERAARRLRPQATRPLSEPSTVTYERFGLVSRAYVECLQDQAIPVEIQRRMQANLPCNPVHTLDCDHSPPLSYSYELTDVLVSISEEFAGRGVPSVQEDEMEPDELVI
jgi:pimeloyl-ACP methyl ester carboxylesterase